jgi:hypothetical protein
MPITCRHSRVEDLERADALVVVIINDLTERHEFGRMANPSPPALPVVMPCRRRPRPLDRRGGRRTYRLRVELDARRVLVLGPTLR